MANTISPQDQLEKTYNAAADHYDHPALSFWDRFGRRTVERLPLAPGMEVLDVCCGMGGSALPAAERVGPSGHVVAVDLAKNLLDKGARRAAQRGLANIEFRRADLENLPFADSSFDAVICVFRHFLCSRSSRGSPRVVAPCPPSRLPCDHDLGRQDVRTGGRQILGSRPPGGPRAAQVDQAME
jgi:SAM-dependent methyltransferase